MRPHLRNELSLEEYDWLVSVPFWHCPEFPLDLIPPRRRGANRHAKTPWFQSLIVDIQANGLRSPVVLNNSPAHQYNTFPEREAFSVRAGNHRVAACRELRKPSMQALVWGDCPKEYIEDGPLTVEAANLYIADGELVLHWHGPVLVGATDPVVEFGGT